MSGKDDTGRREAEKILRDLNSSIITGNLNNVKEFIERENLSGEICKQLSISNRQGISAKPVCLAAEIGHVDIMDFLISVGFDAEETDRRGWYPIHYACQNGKLEVLKSLILKHKVNLDVRNSHYDTPLFLAIQNGKLDIVEFLVESDADVNYCEAMHFTTALHMAADNEPEICECLISAGADVNAEEKNGSTPLHAAAYAGCVETAELLLEGGADVNFQNELSVTAFSAGTHSGNLDLIKLLFERGGDPEAQDVEDYTPLHLSIVSRYHDITRYLVINIGVELGKRNVHKDTPFSSAMKEGSSATAKLLIDAGYDPAQDPCIYDDDVIDMMLDNDDGKEFVEYVRQVACNPRSLQEICCFRIRRLLKRHGPGSADLLPLPQQLKDIVALRHV